MSEQLVTFEVAKLAKEKGFRPETNPFGYITKFYHPITKSLLSYGRTGKVDLKNAFYVPTQSEMQAWLRNQKILVDAIPIHVIDVWGWKVSGVHENGYLYLKEVFSERCSTYEEALEKGLLAGLNSIS